MSLLSTESAVVSVSALSSVPKFAGSSSSIFSFSGAVALLGTFLLLVAAASAAAYIIRVRRRLCAAVTETERLRTDLEKTTRELAAQYEKERVWRIDENRLRSLTTLSADWYWEQDASHRFTMRSSWMLGSERIPAEQFLGRTRRELAMDQDDPCWDELEATMDAHEPFRGFEYRFRHSNRVYWVSVNGEPRFAENGAFIGYRGTGRDITRRKDAEEALRASEERFQEIVNFMPVGLFIKDARSRISLMNLECERLWGVRFFEIEGTDGRHVFTPGEMTRFLETDKRAFENGEIIEVEEACRNVSTNELHTIRKFKKPVFDEFGNPRYLIGISVDVTERKRAEELLRRSKERLRQLAVYQTRLKEEERKRIARDIHDDLGQNLMALRIEVASLVQRTTDAHPRLNQRARSVMDNVDSTIRSVRHIINDLRPAVLDLGLAAALEWQVDEFVKRSPLSCTLEIGVHESELKLDDARATALFRVCQEALTNISRHASASAVRIGLTRRHDSLELSISDNGIGGLPLQERRKGQSFGLLGMRERLVTLGGKLHIESVPGQGTTLVARIPLPAAHPDARALDTCSDIDEQGVTGLDIGMDAGTGIAGSTGKVAS